MWDPQNFGALLRTAYFLGCDKVVVCSKNSAPLSPAVSRASAGAMEVMPVYSTSNMMKFLDESRENGWQVTNSCDFVAHISESPSGEYLTDLSNCIIYQVVGTDLSPKSISLYDVPTQTPTILVLGNEGHGIRTNVLRRCTHLVRIGGAPAGVLGTSGAGQMAVPSSPMHDAGSENHAAKSDSTATVDTATTGSNAVVGEYSEEGGAVDSLNVSVTGAIILHHLLAQRGRSPRNT